MKKVIWKFELHEKVIQRIGLPLGYEILALKTQKGKPCIWVLVDPNELKEEETFEIYGTGDIVTYDMGIDRKYIGTFLSEDDNFVWHLFHRNN